MAGITQEWKRQRKLVSQSAMPSHAVSRNRENPEAFGGSNAAVTDRARAGGEFVSFAR